MASRMWLHLSSVQVVGQSLRGSSMESANFSHRSGSVVLAVLMRRRPFCFERKIRLGCRRTLLATNKWSVTQSAL